MLALTLAWPSGAVESGFDFDRRRILVPRPSSGAGRCWFCSKTMLTLMRNNLRLLLSAAAVVFPLAGAVRPAAAQTSLVTTGAVWKHHDRGVDLGTAWLAPDYDESAWASGRAPLGSNDSHIVTLVNIGPDTNRWSCVYFRKTFLVADPSAYAGVVLRFLKDDGGIIYLNGAEVWRLHMPDPPTDFFSYANFTAGGADETTYYTNVVPAGTLVAGTNVVAVEVHQVNNTSSDLGFDLEIVGNSLPVVALTSPTNGQSFLGPTNLTLTATASDPGGQVSFVAFYQGEEQLGNVASPPYSFVVSNLNDDEFVFTAVAVDNYGASATSAPVAVTIVDPNPPRLTSVVGKTNEVGLAFSKRLAWDPATNTASYTLDRGAQVLAATLGSASNTVTLATTPLTVGQTYTLTLSDLTDLAGNPIAPGTQTNFLVAGFIADDVGAPPLAGLTTPVPGGFDLESRGAGLGPTNDQFHFYYEPRTGDFDLKVQLASLVLSDVWAKAGLMARETLAVNSRYAASLATPNLAGCFFSYRTNTGTGALNAGGFPVTYPSTWLRLQRVGNVFTGYAGVDGNAWTRLGSFTLAMPATIYVGLAAGSQNTNATTTAQFREFSPVVGAGAPVSVTLPREPLGPSSRHTGLVISEFMYHPKRLPGDSIQRLEFVEVFNSQPYFEDVSGYRLSGAIDYIFPSNTVMQPGTFLVVARDPAALEAAQGLSGVLGPWVGAVTNGLPDDAGRLRLRNAAGAVLLEINYAGRPPWPLAADGAGHSLVLARPSYGEDDPRAWAASDEVGGSPGRDEFYASEPLRAVVINEFLANSDPPLEDFIELYNHSNQEVDLSGAWLSDDRDTNKFRIPPGTRLGPRGFYSATESSLGFALRSSGERIYLVSSNQTRVLDAVDFEAQAANVSSGRFPDGAPIFHELSSRTPGEANTGLLLREVVLNELMYHPMSEDSDDEYVELYNRGTNAVDLTGWRFTDGLNFTFPSNTVLVSGGYLVVARDLARLLTKYPQLNATNTVGDYTGSLDNGGERVALSRPDYVVVPGSVLTNYLVVDEVTYTDGGRWSQWADGGGSSLELIDPHSDNRLLANWADSDETAKAPWTNFTATEVLDHVYPRGGAGAELNEIQAMILGAGEALMDDVFVRQGATGTNLVRNPAFDANTTSWLIQGNHVYSSRELAGPNNPSPSLRLRASAGGDNGANRVECDLFNALTPGTNAALGAKLRWLRGHPDVLLRLHGGGLEAVCTLPVPAHLGTPGLPNSRFVTNAGPAIYDVSHAPILPAANEAVVVTARVSDPDGVGSVQLEYRRDVTGGSVNTLAMRDDGTGGDKVAGDGIYSALIPGQAATTLVAFRILGSDALTPAGTSRFPPEAPTRECLVRFGDPPTFGSLGAYRMWLTTSNFNVWRDRERLSNQAQDGTFVYGQWRVVYNAGARYRGSPFIRGNYSNPAGTNVAAAYVWTLPEDDQCLGADELNLDSLEPPNSTNVRDNTALREVTSFTMAAQLGLPFSYQRFVHVILNGATEAARNLGIYSDSQQPNSEYIRSWFADDDDGEIFKIDDWFEFDDTPGMQMNKCASLENFTTTGGAKKQARYRWGWEKKFNRTLNDDYSSLYLVDDALNAPEATYVGAVESAIEADQWLIMLALRHVVGDWDGYGYNRGKNQFIYRPRGKKVWMLLWDLDFSLGCNGGDGPTANLFQVNLQGATGENHMPEISRLYNHGFFRRNYLYALKRIAEGPLQDSAYLPLLNARSRALAENAANVVSPHVAGVPTWIQQRRANVLSTLGPSATTPFTVTSTNLTVTNNLATLSGTAPIGIKYLTVNGLAFPVTWSGATPVNWSIRLLVEAGTTVLTILGYDMASNAVPATARTVTVNYSGQSYAPRDYVVINEIMYRPTATNADFLELLNTSTNYYFDLSNWRVEGLDYTFPPFTYFAPRTYIVLVKDRTAYTTAFGAGAPVFDVFPGRFDPAGEVIALIQPGATPAEDVIVDKVRYEPVLPWSTNAAQGVALQLADPSVDNARASAWADSMGWRFASSTATTTTNTTNLFIFLPAPGDVYLDDVTLVAGSVAGVGSNLVVNGDFESPLSGSWTILGTFFTNSAIVSEVAHSGSGSLHLVGTGGGSLSQTIRQDLTIPPGPYTIGYWYRTSLNGSNVTVRTYAGGPVATASFRPILATPGASNSTRVALPPYPPLWLNEVQPNNLTGPADGFGDVHPWLELYNSGPAPISLEEFYLADNYTTNLTQWQFPPGATIAPGQFLVVWADGEPGETGAGEWHTSFRLDPGTGSVALVRLLGDSPQVMDYLNYKGLAADQSYGDYPDGEPFERRIFNLATPRTNNYAPPVTVFINEWMARNNVGPGGYPDPLDGQYDDWIELYNPGPEPADISGFYLTDTLANPTQWRVPPNTGVPAGGYLLVWADGQTNQNGQSALGDLHVNFQLDRDGEAIGLFAHVGGSLMQVDAVTFGPQFSNISEGRYPDGGAARQFMATATPRAPNVAGNTAPRLAPIPNVTLLPAQPLDFVPVVHDPESPPQALSFSLASATAPGATVDANSGRFTWTPTLAQAPSTNSFTLRVSDNGVPALASMRSFTVHILAGVPMLIGPVPPEGAVPLSFAGVSNVAYGVEWKEAVGLGKWTKMFETPVLSSQQVVTALDTLPRAEGRIYRVVQPPSPGPTNPTPLILTSPKTVIADLGGDAEFSVFAIGTGPLRYQWLSNGIPVPGAIAETLTIQGALPLPEPTNFLGFTVELRDDTPRRETSSPALLAVRPAIFLQPEDQTVQVGDMATFSVDFVLAMEPVRYRWRHNGRPLANATNSTLTLLNVQPSDAGAYSVVVSHPTPIGYVGILSSNAVLTVTGGP
jgi:hypothetical protein